MPANEAQTALADRVRALLSDEADLTEKAMFGSRAFLLDERIAVAVMSAPALLIRVDPDDAVSLVLEPGASPAVMGARQREMGPGWLLIDSEHLTSDEQLLFWVDVARDFQRRRG